LGNDATRIVNIKKKKEWTIGKIVAGESDR